MFLFGVFVGCSSRRKSRTLTDLMDNGERDALLVRVTKSACWVKNAWTFAGIKRIFKVQGFT